MRYHRISILSALANAPLAALATPLVPTWDDIRVKHTWNVVPANWESLGPPPPGTTIDLHLALKPHNENALIDALYEVSSPGNPKYGAHLSKEEVAKLVAPHPDTLELVHSWLAHHAIPSSSISTSHGGGWLALTGVPVSQANEMFSASYQLYQHSGTNDSTILRTVGYALPAILHTHVETVAPTTYFAPKHIVGQTTRRPFVGAAALEKVGLKEPVTVISSRDDEEPEVTTPEFLRWLYGTLDYFPDEISQNALGIVGYPNSFPSETDLTSFLTKYRTEADDAIFDIEEVNGGEYNMGDPGVEANLDMQYSQAIAYPILHVQYVVGGRFSYKLPANEPGSDDVMLGWLDYVLEQERIPQTITFSYGHDEREVPLGYARNVCDLFARLGLRGVSLLFAIGNEGVGGGDCKADDGSGKVQFRTVFPATCPWVTSVGGTTGKHPEVGASLSGGGFSNHFSRPSYQSKAVPDFLHRLGAQHYDLYNAAGRGIPDIAAQARNLASFTGENSYILEGTGCAAPVVAAIISLLNDILISNDKPPLGFLNPWLYGDGLIGVKDILSGSNPGCGTDGFSAISGWDPVTGLGSPDFIYMQEVLYDAIESMPMPTATPRPRE